MLNVTLSRKAKIAVYIALGILAVILGLYLECFDKKEFVVSPVPDSAYVPITNEHPTHYDKDGRLDINTATLEEFDKLYGIGEKLASRIIRYRDEHGAFLAVEELALVSGLSDETIERIYDKICVR